MEVKFEGPREGAGEVSFEELLACLRRDYPELRFRPGRKFMFRPGRTVVFEEPGAAEVSAVATGNAGMMAGVDFEELDGNVLARNKIRKMQVLHEVGHAILGHRDYATDPERLKMERAAWEEARELCEKYGVEYDEGVVEAELDTYRDWLHRRSECPECGLTRFQTRDGRYHCPQCGG